jgi:CHAT domain-containing protein
VPTGTRAAARLRTRAVRAPGRRRLEIRIVHGSIVDANARAVVLGLFRNVDPTGPAAALDARLGGAIRELALRRMFDGSLGQVYVLPVPRTALLAEFAVFAGLGDFDEFGQDAQVYAAENVIRAFARSHVEDFATVLLGAGSGSSVAAALEGQLRGYLAGLRRADPERVLRRITICELDGRKFAALRRAMARVSAELAADDFELVVDEEDTRPPRPSARPRILRTERPADPVYLLATMAEGGRGSLVCRASLLTAGAKAAVLAGSMNVDKVELREQVARIELSVLASRELARAGERLARTLLAPSVREGLASMASHALVVVHDREASQVPWEAIRIDSAWPALEQGTSRRYASEQLSVARWREMRIAGERLSVLLVVDPTEDLPGAAAEGAALHPLLQARGADVELLAGAAATRDRLRSLLRTGAFDVLHFAGHGHFDPARPGESGLVCARAEVLRGADLDGIGDLPALVFFNACEAARVRRRSASRRRSTRQPSTSLAEAFLVGGVANFLGTHWPVGDDAALAFSTHLYPALLGGRPLGTAIRDARRAVQAGGSGDWADYVHYGNASFVLAPGNP